MNEVSAKSFNELMKKTIKMTKEGYKVIGGEQIFYDPKTGKYSIFMYKKGVEKWQKYI